MRETDMRESDMRGADGRAPLKVALLGCGTVGSEVYRLLGGAGRGPGRAGRGAARGRRHRGAPARRSYRGPARCRRAADHRRGLSLVTRPDVDIVIELIGGIEPARTLLLAALTAGKSVVTGQQGAARQRPRRGTAPGGQRRTAPTCTTRARWPARSRCCGRCASRWPATRSAGCSASSTAPRTTSWTRWTPPARTSARRWPRPRRWATPRPTRPPTSQGYDAAAKAAILASLAFHTEVTARGRVPRGHRRR